MGYGLTRRPYLLVGFFHTILGFLLFASGLSWIMLTFFYWPHQVGLNSKEWFEGNPWTELAIEHQTWAWLCFTVQLWSGFWIMLTGCFAMCVSELGCLERLFIFMNVMSMIVFAPAAIVLSLEILFTVTGDLEQYSFIFSQMNTRAFFAGLLMNKEKYEWILAFPIAGMSLGFIEFVLNIVSCGVCMCCRPTRSYIY